MLFRLIAPAALLFLSAMSASAECPGQTGKVVFSDDFSDDSGGWDMDAGEKIANGALAVNADPKLQSDGSLNNTFNATEGDFCAVFTFPTTKVEADNYGFVGLVVLASDYHNRYQFNVDTLGEMWVNKLSNSIATAIMPSTKAAQVKVDPGAENTLRIVVKDQKMTFYINGEKIKTIRVQVADNANHFGFFAGLGKKPAADAQTFLLKSFSLTAAP